MPKINVYLPDELAEAVKDAGVPVSAVCQRALEQAVRRVTAIREVAAEIGPANVLSDPPLVNFTKRAMSVLRSAQASAGDEGMAEIGTGHVLRALLTHGRIAMEILTALDITAQQVRVGLDKRVTPATASRGGATTEPAVSRQVALAIELAANESSGLGHGYVGSEHLLLGLIGEPDGGARDGIALFVHDFAGQFDGLRHCLQTGNGQDKSQHGHEDTTSHKRNFVC